MKNIFKLSVLAGVIAGSFLFSYSAFAEGVQCSGEVSGTAVSSNTNVGASYFDEKNPVDLSILGLADGFAPDEHYAACAAVPSVAGPDYEYLLKGWAWNDNLGFLSFYCGEDEKNEGIDCGPYSLNDGYGVKISAADAGGNRDLTGYAWSQTFGWISLRGTDEPVTETVGPIFLVGATGSPPYPNEDVLLGGVVYNIGLKESRLVGGVNEAWIIVDGGVVRIPEGSSFDTGEIVIEVLQALPSQQAASLRVSKTILPIQYGVQMASSGNLSGYAFSAAGLWLNFAGVKIQLPEEEVPLPDEDWCPRPGVCMKIEPDPKDLIIPEGDVDLGALEVKVADGQEGYLIHVILSDDTGENPLIVDTTAGFDWAHFKSTFALNWKDTVKLNQVSGQIAPASLSTTKEPYTTGKGGVTYKPMVWADFTPYKENGVIVPGDYVSKKLIKSYAPTSDANVSFTTSTDPRWAFENETFLVDIPEVSELERNELILKQATVELKRNDGTIIQPTVIYPGGTYGISFSFRPAIELSTLYADDYQDKIEAYRGIPMNFTMQSSVNGAPSSQIINSATIEVDLTYSEESSNKWCQEVFSEDPDTQEKLDKFAFYFMEEASTECDGTLASEKCETKFDFKSVDLAKGRDFQAIATLGEDSKRLCTMVRAPILYSKVTYKTSQGRVITYYSNKLPRVAGSVLSNPSAVIKGNIYGKAFTPSIEVQSAVTSGSINIDIVHDTVLTNLRNYLRDLTGVFGGGECVVSGLSPLVVSDECPPNTNYKIATVGDEQVIYFSGSDVTLALTGGFSGKHVLVTEGGNIFMDKDIYDGEGSDAELVLVALRKHGQPYGKAGNLYIHPDVKNFQANIVLDGSLFSYNGGEDHDAIDGATGEPIWSGGYAEFLSTLNRQIRGQTSISSRNTIGGADLDTPLSEEDQSNVKNYLVLGTGEVIYAPFSSADRLRAQMYDLNYLRMFKLDLKTYNGLPVDQACGQALSFEDIFAMNQEAVDPDYDLPDYLVGCNGIDPFKEYDPATKQGDLVPPSDPELFAQGVEDNSYSPVYVEYKPNDSFIFEKAGGTSTE